MLGQFKVLHVNIGKRRTAHWSLFCDESLADFDALSVVEPYIYEDLDTGEPAFPVERNWQLFKPNTKQEGEARYAYRAALWVNRRHTAQQLAVTSSDVVAVTIPTKHGSALIVSAYDVKSTDGQAANEEQLRSKLQTIKDAYDRVKALTLSSGRAAQVELLLCADFNRHHVLWGGAQAVGEAGRTDEAEPIIDLMQEKALSSLLPSGTVTWEHYNGSTCSTIDLLLATGGLSEACEYCGVHPMDHGSDHRAIRAHFVVDTTEYQVKRRKRMFDRADWKKIREEVSKRIADDSSLHALSSKDELEVAVDRLEVAVNGVLEEHVTRARPSPYTKRWWTDELKTLRLSLSAARNRLTTVRRRGEDVTEAAASVKLVRRQYMDKIEHCKREYWTEFLDNRENIWKAYAYTKASRAGYGIPVLKFEDAEVTEEREKADLLLSSFFPVPPKPVDRDGSSAKPKLVTRSGSRPREYAGKKVPLRIELPKLTLTEVEAAIMHSKSDKAPGLDDITFRVWKELWPVLGSVVLKLYQASLDLRHVPRRLCTANIVVLRKPNKPDYSNPKAYRPISLLETISKGLEAVVARRLSQCCQQASKLASCQEQ